ncbi:MAG: DUF192 domain-containing protein, partial [Candidatus Sungbacteria bacterium]|nr:DUF192 domain-containing protein [Candidatus Sungbacteria bacterium]
LSGRDSLAYNHGMIFIFLQPGLYRFWMPDMHFPIDIIWIAGERVVGITGDISPEFDPDHPVFYTPPVPAQYALEVNAGFAAANNIKAGDKTIFNGIK